MIKPIMTSALMLAFAIAPELAVADDAPGSSIHGFGETSVKNDYLTPRGLLVTDKFATIQVLGGLVFDVYHNDTQVLSDVSITGGVWNDINSAQHARDVGGWNEFDWFVGADFTVGSAWDLGVQYVQFVSPPGFFNDEQNIEFSVSYADDLKPVAIKPYVKLFYAVSGDSTVVTGAKGGTFDVELGVKPTWDLATYNVPITLSFPTWITVGPSDFWGGTDNWGVFSTGVTATTPLTFIPARLGHWHADAGVQYYNMLNSQLVRAQFLDGLLPSNAHGHREELIYTVGFGFGF